MPQVTVNMHILRECNYRCTFCYATFRDAPGRLPEEDVVRIIEILASAPPLRGDFRIGRINFAGGEPTLHPGLQRFLATVRRTELSSSIVTNGTRLTPDYLRITAPNLDVVALSIESGREDTNRDLGRGTGRHVARTLEVAVLLRQYPHIVTKVNTVVNRLNWEEDMHDLLGRLRPSRWKVFQVTPVDGQNDGAVEPLLITREQFLAFVERHRDLGPVVETEEQIRGSYLMVDPMGRFFSSASGRYVYSAPILEVGVAEALAQVEWNPGLMLDRGGFWNWPGSTMERRAS